MIDLVFLLLIVFMITTPLLENSLTVNPPTLSTGNEPDQNMKTVSMNKDGDLFLDNTPFGKDELLAELKNLREHNPDLKIYLRGDGDRLFKQVLEVMGWMGDAGFEEVNLITQPEQ